MKHFKLYYEIFMGILALLSVIVIWFEIEGRKEGINHYSS